MGVSASRITSSLHDRSTPPASSCDFSKSTLAVAIVHPVKHYIKPISDTSTRVAFFMCPPTGTLGNTQGF
jgi:hypothetical protein